MMMMMTRSDGLWHLAAEEMIVMMMPKKKRMASVWHLLGFVAFMGR